MTSDRSRADRRARVRACWLGKNIGGTLGGPHEGRTGPLALTFYDPIPSGSLPNDDLDLQLVWLHHLRATRVSTVTSEKLAEAWRKHVLWPPDEYGIVRRNDAYGLEGAARGAFDNFFSEGLGAAIRSELWACLCPGDPARAAEFARIDAVVDHCGDGVHAAVFHAALQAAAFTGAKLAQLIPQALDFIPNDSRLKHALHWTIDAWRSSPDWRALRQEILVRYGTGNFTDVVCNLCFELLALFAGAGDFGATLCTAVNCGLDTDCTAATLGALLGIMAPHSIPQRWLDPIGEAIVVSSMIVGIQAPRDLEELTDWTLELQGHLKPDADAPRTVVPRRPEPMTAGPVIALCYQRCFVDALDAARFPQLDWQPHSAGGHWWQLTARDFAAEYGLFRFGFQTETAVACCVMTYCSGGARTWIDGGEAIRYTEADVRNDPMIAPSLHRSHCTRKDFGAGELEPGDHELIVACRRPPPGVTIDFIVGVGDVDTRFWRPWALASKA